MVVHTDSERVRTSRRLVLELLGFATDLSTAPDAQRYIAEYDAHPERLGTPPAPAPKLSSNDLYMRDYRSASSVTSASRPAASTTRTRSRSPFPPAAASRRTSPPSSSPVPDSACVYCGNCIAVCPTGALMPTSEFELRAAGEWREPGQTDTICPYCGVACTLTLHTQDDEIVKVSSPDDHDVTARQPLHQGPLRIPVRQDSKHNLQRNYL